MLAVKWIKRVILPGLHFTVPSCAGRRWCHCGREEWSYDDCTRFGESKKENLPFSDVIKGHFCPILFSSLCILRICIAACKIVVCMVSAFGFVLISIEQSSARQGDHVLILREVFGRCWAQELLWQTSRVLVSFGLPKWVSCGLTQKTPFPQLSENVAARRKINTTWHWTGINYVRIHVLTFPFIMPECLCLDRMITNGEPWLLTSQHRHSERFASVGNKHLCCSYRYSRSSHEEKFSVYGQVLSSRILVRHHSTLT